MKKIACIVIGWIGIVSVFTACSTNINNTDNNSADNIISKEAEEDRDEENISSTRMLTKNDVLELAEKGENIVWGDLRPFTHGEDIGSGLYIVCYKIDDEYTLTVGGGYPVDDEHPVYAYLNNTDTNQSINIMKESPEDFLK